MKKTIGSILIMSSLAFAGSNTHWGYTGHEGPENWGNLDAKYKMCEIGLNQSPVNITSSIEADLAPIGFNYTTGAKEILNNGHTVQINVENGNDITIDGKKYNLIQLHFHTPSENQINNKSFPLEAHFVHADKDNNLAVVAVMFEEGLENKQLAKIWANMPMKKDEKVDGKDKLDNLNDLLPKEQSYYRFNGSLTTPPCSEGVKWLVLDTPLTISKEQVEQFSHAVHGKNNRPIQPIKARIIVH
jgi:carbonic anhydrase